MGDQTQSWRAGVLLSLAPTPIKHLNQLIKVLLETSMQVCWGKLELNSAGHRFVKFVKSSLVTPELIIQYFILLWNML